MNTYIFIGKLYPKPVHFSFPYFESSISSSKDKNYDDLMKIAVKDNVINITLESQFQYDPEELGVLKNSLLYLVKGFLDSFGYCYHMAFNIDIQGVIQPDKTLLPLLGVPSKTETQEQHNLNGKAILQLLHKSSSLNRALVDYRNALMIPEDAGFFLYRTTEDIRRHFEKRYKLNEKQAWIKMNEELSLDPNYIKSKIKPFADESRHGELVSLTQNVGIELFLKTRKVIDRFILYIQNQEKKLSLPLLG